MGLVGNKNLHEEIWENLFQSSLPPEQAKLLHGATSRQQALRLLALNFNVTRIAAIRLGVPHLLETDLLALAQQPFFDPSHAAAMLQSGLAPQSIVPQLWKQVKTIDYHPTPQTASLTMSINIHTLSLEALATKYQTADNDELLENIISFALPYKNIARILDYRPCLLPALTAQLTNRKLGGLLTEIALAVAISQHLTAPLANQLYNFLTLSQKAKHKHLQIAQALADNPASPSELRVNALNWRITHAGDSGELANLHQTQLRARAQLKAPAPHPLTQPWVTLYGPALALAQEFIKSQGADCYPALLGTELTSFTYQREQEEQDVQVAAFINESLSPVLDAAHSQAWEIFLSLLPTWHTTTAELLSTALATAAP